jgi:hypothetical protein
MHWLDPKLEISGNIASASVEVLDGVSYGWRLGLWQASDPALTVTDLAGAEVDLELAGMSARPEVSRLIEGTPTTCLCADGTEADCMRGDHYSNGLVSAWTRAGSGRFNAWTACQHSGT